MAARYRSHKRNEAVEIVRGHFMTIQIFSRTGAAPSPG